MTRFIHILTSTVINVFSTLGSWMDGQMYLENNAPVDSVVIDWDKLTCIYGNVYNQMIHSSISVSDFRR